MTTRLPSRLILLVAGILTGACKTTDRWSAESEVAVDWQEPDRRVLCTTFMRVVDGCLFERSGPSPKDYDACRHELAALGFVVPECRPVDEFVNHAMCTEVDDGMLRVRVDALVSSKSQAIDGQLLVECGTMRKHVTKTSAISSTQIEIAYSELPEIDQNVLLRLAVCSAKPRLDPRNGRRKAVKTSGSWRIEP